MLCEHTSRIMLLEILGCYHYMDYLEKVGNKWKILKVQKY